MTLRRSLSGMVWILFLNVLPCYSSGAEPKTSVDVDAVYTGLFAPSNVLIHVAQNIFNVVVTSVAWFAIAVFLEPTVGRSIEV